MTEAERLAELTAMFAPEVSDEDTLTVGELKAELASRLGGVIHDTSALAGDMARSIQRRRDAAERKTS